MKKDNYQYSIIKLIPHPFYDNKLIPTEYVSETFKNWDEFVANCVMSGDFYYISEGEKTAILNENFINYKERLHNIYALIYAIDSGARQLYAVVEG